MARGETSISKLLQIRIKKILWETLNRELIAFLDTFDPEEHFDGENEKEFALDYYLNEMYSTLIDTIADIEK
jgi:hypothetical protein